MKKLQIYMDYMTDVARWRLNNAHYIDIKPFTMNDIFFIKIKLHPTNKQDSKNITKKMLEFIHTKRIVTADEIYDELSLSETPVLNRMKIFREFGLVRREGKKYYMATPRMDEVMTNRWHERICS